MRAHQVVSYDLVNPNALAHPDFAVLAIVAVQYAQPDGTFLTLSKTDRDDLAAASGSGPSAEAAIRRLPGAGVFVYRGSPDRVAIAQDIKKQLAAFERIDAAKADPTPPRVGEGLDLSILDAPAPTAEQQKAAAARMAFGAALTQAATVQQVKDADAAIEAAVSSDLLDRDLANAVKANLRTSAKAVLSTATVAEVTAKVDAAAIDG